MQNLVITLYFVLQLQCLAEEKLFCMFRGGFFGKSTLVLPQMT